MSSDNAGADRDPREDRPLPKLSKTEAAKLKKEEAAEKANNDAKAARDMYNAWWASLGNSGPPPQPGFAEVSEEDLAKALDAPGSESAITAVATDNVDGGDANDGDDFPEGEESEEGEFESEEEDEEEEEDAEESEESEGENSDYISEESDAEAEVAAMKLCKKPAAKICKKPAAKICKKQAAVEQTESEEETTEGEEDEEEEEDEESEEESEEEEGEVAGDKGSAEMEAMGDHEVGETPAFEPEKPAAEPEATGTGEGPAPMVADVVAGQLVVAGPDLDAAALFCSACKGPLLPGPHRMTEKMRRSYKCPVCNKRSTQLSRVFGGWPPKIFKSLPEEFQTKIWNDLKAVDGSARIEKFIVDTLVRKHTEIEETICGGEYLPLSAYKKRGYNTKDIETNCKNRLEDPVVGLVYKLDIKSGWSKTVESMVRTELYKTKSSSTPQGADSPAPLRDRSPAGQHKSRSRSARHGHSRSRSRPRARRDRRASRSRSRSRTRARRDRRASRSRSRSRTRARRDRRTSRSRSRSRRQGSDRRDGRRSSDRRSGRSRSPSGRSRSRGGRSLAVNRRRRDPSRQGGRDDERGPTPRGTPDEDARKRREELKAQEEARKRAEKDPPLNKCLNHNKNAHFQI